jgi:pyridoxal/pyridoxine/pyridoxamine kinase
LKLYYDTPLSNLAFNFKLRQYSAADYVCPNESELARLTGGLPTGTDEDVVAAAQVLRAMGAR